MVRWWWWLLMTVYGTVHQGWRWWYSDVGNSEHAGQYCRWLVKKVSRTMHLGLELKIYLSFLPLLLWVPLACICEMTALPYRILASGKLWLTLLLMDLKQDMESKWTKQVMFQPHLSIVCVSLSCGCSFHCCNKYWLGWLRTFCCVAPFWLSY